MRHMITGVGLITTFTEKYGPNIMSAEWTMAVSHNPPMILVVVGNNDATAEMINESREFGVNVAADDQSSLVSLAGNFTRYESDKLSSQDFVTYQAKKIRAPMVEGAAVNAECILRQTVPLGDHTGFVGEVIEISHDSQKKPLIYHEGHIWKLTEPEKTPGLYVIGTYNPSEKIVKAEGRVRGSDDGKVELTLVQNDKESEKAAVQVDARGFFEHKWTVDGTNVGSIIEANSGPLMATARVAGRRLHEEERATVSR